MKTIIKKLLYTPPSSGILMFHHVSSSPKYEKSGCKVSQEEFIKEISEIRSFDTLDYVLNNPKQKKIAITFDDGLQDVYTVAYPYLKKRGVPFAVFIVTDFLDQNGYISTEELIEMSKDSLVTVGAHGVTHRVLKDLPTAVKRMEIIGSKHILERITGKRVDLFAYSHGQFDRKCFSILKEGNFRFAMGVLPYPINVFTKHMKYNIPRYNVVSRGICETNEKLSLITELR